MYTSWQKTAQNIISEAIRNNMAIEEENHLAIIAAKALLTDLQSVSHPSYSNTIFAMSVFMPESMVSKSFVQRMAFNVLVNGLSGYFQWISHNGGEFSVSNALIHTGVLTPEEAKHLRQFEAYPTGHNYFAMNYDFLARITERWNLPLSNPTLGGKKGRTKNEKEDLEYLKQQYPSFVSSDGEANIRRVLSIL
jgi:hypothetical protein